MFPCDLLQQINWTQAGGCWNLTSAAGWSEAQVAAWSGDWCLKCVGGRGSPKGLSPQPVGADALSGKMTSELGWTVGCPGGVTENCLVLRKPVTRLVIRILFCVSSKGSTQERDTARKEKLLQKEEKCGFSSLYDGIMQHHRMQLLIEYLNFVMAKIPQTNNFVCFHLYVAVWLKNGEKSAWKLYVQEITCRKWLTLRTLDGTVDNGNF